MSLIFEALKKGHTSPANSRPPPILVSPGPVVIPSSGAASGAPLSALMVAVLVGMILAGTGAWLYWAGRAASTGMAPLSPSPLKAHESGIASALVPASTAAPAPVAQIAPPVSAASNPPVSDRSTPKASLPDSSRKSLTLAGAPVPKTAALPASNAVGAVAALPALPASSVQSNTMHFVPATLINVPPRASVDPNAFDARETLQNLIKQLQTGQLAQAQVSADRITGTLGRGHVMSLRAQGSLALHKGDLALAHGQYGELYQLLPDDREAGLNLALIEWRQGNKDSATRRIARLLEKLPNDQEIQALNLNMRNP